MKKHVYINNIDKSKKGITTVMYDSDVMTYNHTLKIFSTKPDYKHKCNICLSPTLGILYTVETRRDKYNTVICHHSICHTCKRQNIQDKFHPKSDFSSDKYAVITYTHCENCKYKIDKTYFTNVFY